MRICQTTENARDAKGCRRARVRTPPHHFIVNGRMVALGRSVGAVCTESCVIVEIQTLLLPVISAAVHILDKLVNRNDDQNKQEHHAIERHGEQCEKGDLRLRTCKNSQEGTLQPESIRIHVNNQQQQYYESEAYARTAQNTHRRFRKGLIWKMLLRRFAKLADSTTTIRG